MKRREGHWTNQLDSGANDLVKDPHAGKKPVLLRRGASRFLYKRRRVWLGLIGILLLLNLFSVYDQTKSHHGRQIFLKSWEHRWNRFVWKVSSPTPRGTLVGSLSTRRQNLEFDSKLPSMERVIQLVDRHLQHLEEDMSVKVKEFNKTVVLLWSGNYPVWNAKVTMGIDKNCNIPCEWTKDRNYNDQNEDKVTGLVCLLYNLDKKGQCRDIPEKMSSQLPIVGISWENDWRTDNVGLDELPSSQIWKMKQKSPYNLISSYELDSHIPALYPHLADFIESFQVETLDELERQQEDKKASVMFTISNCKASLRPDRLGVIQELASYFSTSSFGGCLGEPANYALEWNYRGKYGNPRHLEEMSKYLFLYAPENSYGIDYVTEKVYLPLIASAVPVYLGAPNIAAFLPDRDAVIHVSDFGSIRDLATYLDKLSRNRTLLVERHHSWRTRSLPTRLLKLNQLVDRNSTYSYACKVCNCIRGRIGCPDLLNVG